ATCSDALMDFRSSLKEANELLVQEYSQSVAQDGYLTLAVKDMPHYCCGNETGAATTVRRARALSTSINSLRPYQKSVLFPRIQRTNPSRTTAPAAVLISSITSSRANSRNMTSVISSIAFCPFARFRRASK